MTNRIFQAGLHPSAASRGASLIEVLIAVLILAIGMLGVAALQSSALRNSQSSLERSQAVFYTYTILDSMRSNSAIARSGGYNMAMVTGTCTPPAAAADLSVNDRRMWLQAMQADMGPTACGDIQCGAIGINGTSSCVVRVRWDDSRAGGSTANERIVATVTEL